ncbi:MAG: M48 family metallopeptidase [Candidatus Eisenbacteria bacterium]|nr:M48 family metallopeptidase [Candidatus Eisenbacteria bacterium]
MGFPLRGRGGIGGGRLIIALVLVVISVITYFSQQQKNPVTGETQHISMSAEQEVAIGLQAAPEMAAQHGGLHSDPQAQAMVDRVGNQLVAGSPAAQSGYPFEFHLLADPNMINAFALPGGQVFITAGLMNKLETEGELAGVLGHEIGHVVGRHGAEHMAKAQLTQGLTGAAVIATYDPNDPGSRNTAAVAQMIGQMINMKYGRDDELESDRLGVEYAAKSGYDPRSMLRVMEVLAQASQGQAPPEMMSTHPDPGNRTERIEQLIQEMFPGGVPEGLVK